MGHFADLQSFFKKIEGNLKAGNRQRRNKKPKIKNDAVTKEPI